MTNYQSDPKIEQGLENFKSRVYELFGSDQTKKKVAYLEFWIWEVMQTLVTFKNNLITIALQQIPNLPYGS